MVWIHLVFFSAAFIPLYFDLIVHLALKISSKFVNFIILFYFLLENKLINGHVTITKEGMQIRPIRPLNQEDLLLCRTNCDKWTSVFMVLLDGPLQFSCLLKA